MSELSRDYEAAALRAFRRGVPEPLLSLAAQALERVMASLTSEELMVVGTLRRHGCRHAATTLTLSVPGIGNVVHTLRCMDCGESLKRLESMEDPPSIGVGDPQCTGVAGHGSSGTFFRDVSRLHVPEEHELMNIVLVDDHKIIRDGLRAVLAKENDLHIAGEADDGRTAIELCATLRPDVVVMDIGMPNLNGTEATRQVSRRNPETKVVALSMNHDRHFVREMFEAGAWGYCVKSAAGEELVRAIRAVAQHEKYVSPAVASSVLEEFVGGPRHSSGDGRPELTPREREVLQLVAEGLTSKEMAVRLELAVSTVETHRKQIMAKLQLRSVAELTKFAIRKGLTTL